MDKVFVSIFFFFLVGRASSQNLPKPLPQEIYILHEKIYPLTEANLLATPHPFIGFFIKIKWFNYSHLWDDLFLSYLPRSAPSSTYRRSLKNLKTMYHPMTVRQFCDLARSNKRVEDHKHIYFIVKRSFGYEIFPVTYEPNTTIE